MLYMVIEQFKDGRGTDVYERFRERGRLASEGLRYVDSWVDLAFRRCFQVMGVRRPSVAGRVDRQLARHRGVRGGAGADLAGGGGDHGTEAGR
jgi:hypothetical protein